RGARRMSAMVDVQTAPSDNKSTLESTTALMRELVAHLRENRTGLREEWLRRIFETELLTAMSREEVFAEATSVYDSYVEALETRTLRRSRPMRRTSPSGSSRAASRPTRSSASCCCCATCWRARCSRSTT